MSDTALAPYLRMWSLKAAGAAIATPTAILQPVTCPDGRDAMLRLATAVSDDEDCTTSGADLLQAWNGHGAAQVYARKGHALLIESAVGTDSLIDMAQNGNDAAATQILCDTAARLHAHNRTAFFAHSAGSVVSRADYPRPYGAIGHLRPNRQTASRSEWSACAPAW